MRLHWRSYWDVIKQSGQEFITHKATRLGAALAFYTALSLAPMLLVVMGIAGLVFGPEAARGGIAEQLNNLIGEQGAQAVEDMLAHTTSQRSGIIATIIGLSTLFIGATGVFAQLQDALDTIWNVKPDQTASGIWGYIRDRLLSFSMICGMAFLLLVSLVFSAILAALGGVFDQWLPFASVWLRLANCVASYLLTGAMFAMIFKVLPHARPNWSDVWIGAGITALLFLIGKYLIGLYLGRASIGSTYGAAGSFVVLLFWIYYSSLILLFGAEFTQVYALRHGSGVKSVAGLTPADPRISSGAAAHSPNGPGGAAWTAPAGPTNPAPSEQTVKSSQ